MPTVASISGVLGYGRGKINTGPPPNTLRVAMIGDTNRATLITNLNTARTALGYTTTITYTSIDAANYNGSGLSTANYDVAVVYTNGGAAPASAGGIALNNFIAAGGTVVFLVFCWGNVTAIPSFTYTNSPYAYLGASSSGFAPTITKIGTHPITDGLGTSMGTSVFRSSNIVLQSNATNLGWYPDGTTSMIAVQSSPRRVGINIFPASGVTSNGYQLIVKSIMWAGGLLN
jgi:hypothetical protein